MKRQVRRVVDPPCIRRSTVEPMTNPSTIMMLVSLVGLTVHAGCVRRTLTIDTDPQGAIVTLNDEEIGATPVSRDFLWYGDYDVVLRKKGYVTLHDHVVVHPPWYQLPPFDFIADVLWPGRIHDQRHASFKLEPWTPPTHDEVVERAMELREKVLTAQGGLGESSR